MFINELHKISKNKLFNIILLISIFLNAILLIYHCTDISAVYINTDALYEQHILNTASYPITITNIITQSEINLQEFNILSFTDHDYNVKYQQYTIDIYTNLPNTISFTNTPTTGWNVYFSYQIENIFILCLSLISGIVIFTQDHIAGVYPIIFSSKNGRSRTVTAKLCTSVSISFAITAVFILEKLLIISVFFKFSSPFVFLQNIEKFYLCPFAVSIFEYFLISFILKLLAAVSFCFVTECLCVFIKNYAVIYISCFGFLCLNFILNIINYINPSNLIKTTNLFALIDTSIYFDRLRAINILGNVVTVLDFTVLFYSLMTVLLFCGITCKYTFYSHNIKSIRYLTKLIDFYNSKIMSEQKKICRIRDCSHSLYGWELHKTLRSKKIIPFMCLITLLKLFVSMDEYEPILSYSDAVYHDYMTELAGEDSLEKRDYILAERTGIDTTIVSFGEIQSQYYDNRIDAETYRLKLNEYNVAANKDPILQKIESHAYYIDEMAAAGNDAWFVYDTGWIKLFCSSFDWTLYAAILLITISVFSSEYDSNTSAGGFDKILRTTYNGRSKTFKAKYLSSIFLALCVFVIYHLTDLILLNSAFDLPLFNAPICSIESFKSITDNISIIEFYLFFLATKIISVILLTVIFCSLSELLTNLYAALTVSTAVSVLPALLALLGFETFRKVDYTLFMQAAPLILNNTVIVFIVVVSIIGLGLLLLSRRKWCS